VLLGLSYRVWDKTLEMHSLGPYVASVSGPIRFYFFVILKKKKFVLPVSLMQRWDSQNQNYQNELKRSQKIVSTANFDSKSYKLVKTPISQIRKCFKKSMFIVPHK
jgi:hypothetical protein